MSAPTDTRSHERNGHAQAIASGPGVGAIPGGDGGGLGYMVGAAFFFSTMTLFARMAGERLPTAEIVFARSVLMLVFSYWLVRRAKVSLRGVRRSLLILRGAAGFAALFCFFYAVKRLPLADVTVIHFTNPVWTALLAAIFLRERTGAREAGGLGLSLVGVTLVAQPAFLFGARDGALELGAVGVALLGAALSSVAYTSVRKLRETDHHLVVIFYFPLIAAPASIPLMIGNAVWPSAREWALLVALGIVTQIAQIFLTRGLHRERAGRAMSISYVQVLFAMVWGAAFFAERPDWLSAVGAALVFAGSLIVAGRLHGGSR